eukprot:210547-Rhodomonas_salina.1
MPMVNPEQLWPQENLVEVGNTTKALTGVGTSRTSSRTNQNWQKPVQRFGSCDVPELRFLNYFTNGDPPGYPGYLLSSRVTPEPKETLNVSEYQSVPGDPKPTTGTRACNKKYFNIATHCGKFY